MANKPLSALTAGAALDVADLFLASQSGNSRKVTGQQLLDFSQKVPERVLADLGLLGKVTFKAASALVTLDGIPFVFTSVIERGNGGIRVLSRARGDDTAITAPADAGDDPY